MHENHELCSLSQEIISEGTFFTGTYFGSHIGTLAIETFKIINKETPQYLHDLATLKNNKYNFRYSNTAHIPTVKTTGMELKCESN
jgi:hypothetical protein